MSKLLPFEPRDALEIIVQPAQQIGWHDKQAMVRLFDGAHVQGFTLRNDAGEILFCGGAVERHPPIGGVGGHAQLWAMFALGKRMVMPKLRRMTRQFIAELEYGRVDAAVDDTPAAIRWAEMLDLRLDVRLQDAAVGGGDMLIYRRTE